MSKFLRFLLKKNTSESLIKYEKRSSKVAENKIMYNFLTLIMTNPSKKYRLNVQKKQTKIKSKEKEKY